MTTRKKIVGILLVLLSGGWLFVIPFIPLTSNKTVNFHFPVEEGAIKSAGVKPNQVIKSYPKFILDDLPHTFNRTLLKALCNISIGFFWLPWLFYSLSRHLEDISACLYSLLENLSG